MLGTNLRRPAHTHPASLSNPPSGHRRRFALADVAFAFIEEPVEVSVALNRQPSVITVANYLTYTAAALRPHRPAIAKASCHLAKSLDPSACLTFLSSQHDTTDHCNTIPSVASHEPRHDPTQQQRGQPTLCLPNTSVKQCWVSPRASGPDLSRDMRHVAQRASSLRHV